MSSLRGGKIPQFCTRRHTSLIKTARLGSTSGIRSTPQSFRQFAQAERAAQRRRQEELQGVFAPSHGLTFD